MWRYSNDPSYILVFVLPAVLRGGALWGYCPQNNPSEQIISVDKPKEYNNDKNKRNTYI